MDQQTLFFLFFSVLFFFLPVMVNKRLSMRQNRISLSPPLSLQGRSRSLKVIQGHSMLQSTYIWRITPNDPRVCNAVLFVHSSTVQTATEFIRRTCYMVTQKIITQHNI